MFCPKCGKEIVADARFCTNCGTDIQKALECLNENGHISGISDTVKAKNSTSGRTASEDDAIKIPKTKKTAIKKSENGWRDLSVTIGKNQEYYLAEFQKVSNGEKTRFNWAAFFFGPGFCFYRRCGELFKKYFLVSSFLLFFGCLVEMAGIRQFDLMTMFCGTVIVAIGGILQIINMVRFAYEFNRAYYKHCQNSAVELPVCTGVSWKSAICFYAVCALIVLGISGLMILVDGMDLTQCVAWVTIAFLAWFFLKPYIMTFLLSKKNRTGIRTNLTTAQLIELIEDDPWCENQVIREYISEIPGTHEQSQLNFVGLRSEVYFRVENGILHAYGFTATKVEKFRRLYLVHIETRKLLQYIAALERQDTETATRLKQSNISAIKLRSGYDTFDKFCWIIAAAALIALPIFFEISGIGRTSNNPVPAFPSEPPMSIFQSAAPVVPGHNWESSGAEDAIPSFNNDSGFPTSDANDFPPTLPPIDPNDPNADLLSDHLGLYVNENGYYLSMEVASQDGSYFGAIYSNRSNAQNGINPLIRFSMGGRDYLGTFIFTDYEENTLYFARDAAITDYYTLLMYGDSYFDGVDISPFFDTTFYMVEQYIDVMS